MVDDKAWEELNREIGKLSQEYAGLKNTPRLFETEKEKSARENQLEKDKHEKRTGFDSLGTDFEKKRDYVLKLKKEVEILKVRKRKDDLEQKLKDQVITEEELLELQVLILLY